MTPRKPLATPEQKTGQPLANRDTESESGYATAKSESDRRERLHVTVRRLNDAVHRIREGDVGRLNARLEEVLAEATLWKNLGHALESDNARYRTRVTELEARVSELENVYAEEVEGNAELEVKYAEQVKDNAELVAWNAEVRARTVQLEVKNVELEVRNVKLNARNAELETRIVEHAEREAESSGDVASSPKRVPTKT